MSTPARAWRTSVGAIAIAGVVIALAPPSDAVVMPPGSWLVLDPAVVAQCAEEADPIVRTTLGCDAVLEPQPEQEAEPTVDADADAAPPPLNEPDASEPDGSANGSASGDAPASDTAATPEVEVGAAVAVPDPDVLASTGVEEPIETPATGDPGAAVPETDLAGAVAPETEVPLAQEPAVEELVADAAVEPVDGDPAATAVRDDVPAPSSALAGDLLARFPAPAAEPEPAAPDGDDGPTPSSDLGRDLVGAPAQAEPQPLIEVLVAPAEPLEPPPASDALGTDLAAPPEATAAAAPDRTPDESAELAGPLPGDPPPAPDPEPASEPDPEPIVVLPTELAEEGAEADLPPGQAQGVLPDVPADPAGAGEQQVSEEAVPDPADDPADVTVAPPASAPAPLPVTGIVTAGVPIDVVLDTIRTLESDGRYEIGPNRSGASGAYQYIVKTWNGYAGYPEAYLAPPAVQDQRAREDVQRVLATYGGDVTAVPLWWYYPISLRDPSWLDRVPNPAHNTLTVRQYQTRWLTIYNQKLAAYAPAPAVPATAPDTVRTIAFPVLGPTSYWNDWGACRDGCSRRHQGNDLLGVRMQPLLAAVDGTVTRIRYENVGKAGSVVTVTGADGWYYNYFHVNNDTPGSDDGWAGPEWQASPYLQVGMSVRAGQIIGYMGDSGNAEGSVPHVHFEIRSPAGVAVNPYPSLIAARARQQCSIGLGPWSTMVDPAAAAAPAVSIAPLFGTGAWNIDAVGRVTATGDAALVYSKSPEGCPPGPATPFGTGAEGGGLPGGLLPLGAELALGAPVEQSGREVVELPTPDGSSVRMLVEPAGTATPGSNGRPPTW